MEAQWLRVFSLSKYHWSAYLVPYIESVLLINLEHVESQIVCLNIHQRGNVKKGRPNMGIG